MARYYFHLIDGKFLIDEEGTECLNLADAREQALATAGAILRDYASDRPPGLEWQMHVTDEARKPVLKLHFSLQEIAPALTLPEPVTVEKVPVSALEHCASSLREKQRQCEAAAHGTTWIPTIHVLKEMAAEFRKRAEAVEALGPHHGDSHHKPVEG